MNKTTLLLLLLIGTLSGHAQDISCWGDSKTAGGPNVSYPDLLETLLRENGYDITVHNFGASGERSTEIMQRQGAMPLIVEPFTIPAEKDQEVRISINSRLRNPDAGCNPCYISGVKGIIRHDWDDESERTFYFSRIESGDAVTLEAPENITTDAMINHRNDILILDIGYNGGFGSVSNWIDQYKQMVEYSLCKEYIIIGRASHYYGVADAEKPFEEEFGDRFINLRRYYVESGLKDAGLEPTQQDLVDMARGVPPKSLFRDEHHENDFGYQLKAQQVFNRLMSLNIIGPASAISTPPREPHHVKGIYTLQGVKIDRIDKPGLYIINGKKVVVRSTTK